MGVVFMNAAIFMKQQQAPISPNRRFCRVSRSPARHNKQRQATVCDSPPWLDSTVHKYDGWVMNIASAGKGNRAIISGYENFWPPQ